MKKLGALLNSKRLQQNIFAFGLIFFFVGRFAPIAFLIASGSPTIEVDDMYTYVVRGAQVEDCFFQDCPSFQSIKEIALMPTENDDVLRARSLSYQRVFYFVYPFHSFAISMLHTSFINWEAALYITVYLGGILFYGAIAYWLRKLFGEAPAGMALSLLAVMYYKNQGIFYIIPSTLSLAVMLATWSFVLEKKEKSGKFILGGIFIMLGIHPLGQIYGGFTLFLFVLIAWNYKFSRQVVSTVVGGFALIFMRVLLPYFVKSPLMQFTPLTSLDLTYMESLGFNLDFGIELTGLFTSVYSWLLLAILLVISILFMKKEDSREILSTGFILTGMTIGSLLIATPGYEGEVFQRMWVAETFFLVGIIGFGTWQVLGLLSKFSAGASVQLDTMLSEDMVGSWLIKRNGLSVPYWALQSVLIILLVWVGSATLQFFKLHIWEYINQIAYHYNYGAYDIPYAYNQTIEDRLQDGGGISHTTLDLLLINLPREGMQFPTIYESAIENDTERMVLYNQYNVQLVSTMNPINSCFKTRRGLMPVRGIEPLTISIPESLDTLFIFLKSKEGISLDINVDTDIDSLALRDGGYWYAIDNLAGMDTLTLSLKEAGKTVWLGGIRVESDSTLYWPWDSEVSVTIQTESPNCDAINFLVENFSQSATHSLIPIYDEGSAVLLEIEK